MTDKPKDEGRATAKPAADADEDLHEKVPAEAENMEHTLRRLTAEKQKRREKDPGLYL